MCFSGSGPTHFFRRWVKIGIGPTHFLRWIVYYCVCIQHDIDKSQISFIELCKKTLRTNSGLRAINSCLHFLRQQLCKACRVNIVLWQQNLKFSFHQQTVEFGPTHIFTQIYAPASDTKLTRRSVNFDLAEVESIVVAFRLHDEVSARRSAMPQVDPAALTTTLAVPVLWSSNFLNFILCLNFMNFLKTT